MGEACRARDARLGRDVAIKVLPPTLASDPQFHDRFAGQASITVVVNWMAGLKGS